MDVPTAEEMTQAMQAVFDGLIESANQAAQAMKDFANALCKYKYNNWRKFHHIPMKRRN